MIWGYHYCWKHPDSVKDAKHTLTEGATLAMHKNTLSMNSRRRKNKHIFKLRKLLNCFTNVAETFLFHLSKWHLIAFPLLKLKLPKLPVSNPTANVISIFISIPSSFHQHFPGISLLGSEICPSLKTTAPRRHDPPRPEDGAFEPT